jgi:hypothetical protein
MTDKELRKLSRMELVEILLMMTRENEQLTLELEETKAQLEDRKLQIENAGSLAEASLQLNQVFEAAQAACEQYLENVQYRSANQREICDRMEQETQDKCRQMLEKAKREADDYWDFVRARVKGLYGDPDFQSQNSAEEEAL